MSETASRLLWEKLDAKRADLDFTWRQVARSAGVAPSVTSRLKVGRECGLENANKLFAWLRDDRVAVCVHDWRLGHVIHGLGLPIEHYYCTRCLERQALVARGVQ